MELEYLLSNLSNNNTIAKEFLYFYKMLNFEQNFVTHLAYLLCTSTEKCNITQLYYI